MINKNPGFTIFLSLFILLLPGLLLSVNPNVGEWTGTTSRDNSMSFTVGSGGSQWNMFTLETDWSAGSSYGTLEITAYGPGNISGNNFSYYGNNYSFTGKFTSSSTASGTYSFNGYKIAISYYPYPQYIYLTQTGTWTATGPLGGESDPPFGSFDTPIDGSTVRSSIAVTGWALDDSGVESVKIYREQGKDLVYIGDGVFVEGARPDVAALYPQYPNNTRAGWGYMMLTNFLPNGGNGTFVIHAFATDTVGKTTTLGTKTIYCDNANAVKPFGAIDTPTQGGTASGSSFINWGWVLTPQPNSIPVDGSTISVYVDGVNIGNPTYNIYRSDIAGLFPGYANSNGAAGYFYLDTTGYADGVHTIQWTATDTGNNTDGIGSRYFTINNTGGDSQMQAQISFKQSSIPNFSQIAAITNDYSVPVRVKQGYDADVLADLTPVDEKGMNRVVIREMGRLEIHLSDQPSNDFTYSGYLVIGERLMKLPVGSTLNPKTGVFSWIPGPGHLGPFHLVFIETAPDGTMTKKNTIVEIVPKQY